MNRRQKIIVSVTGIFLVLLLLVGLTYGYFLTRVTGNTNTKSISVKTANLALVYGDGNGILEVGDVVSPGDIVKFKTTGGATANSKTFTVTNEGNATTDYVVVIENVNVTYTSTVVVNGETHTAGTETTFESNDFVYTLTCTSGCNGTENSVFPMNGGILVGNSIDVDEEQTYELTMMYKETGKDQSNDMNKTFTARINIMDVSSLNPYSSNTSSLAYNIVNNAKEKKNGTELTNTPLTSPANETSKFLYKTHEAEIATTESSVSINTTYQSRYWTYATDYIVDETTGKFSLVDPKVCLYNDTDLTDNTEIECDELISTMVSNGETIYILSTSASSNTNTTATLKTTTNKSNIYLVTTAPVSSTSTITMKAKKLTSISSYSIENSLSLTTDDYGTSYYYRGSVEDNYVNFAGMCWRIVRIAGDGSIKLILEDQDQPCSTSINGNWAIPTTTGGTAYTGDFGNTHHLSNTLTASDGTKNSSTRYLMDYLHGQTNSDKSMATAFKNFQSTFTDTELSKLKAGNWCLGDNAYDSSNNLLNSTQIMDNKIKGTSFNYDSYQRLGGNNGYQPTLKCNGTIMNDWDDNETNPTPMYVGAITADEVAYAGGKISTSNQNYYLINEEFKKGSSGANKSSYFWSLSPFNFVGNGDRAFVVNYNGDLSYSNVYNTIAFRPSVSLASGTKISTGDGTINSPYTIAE